MNKIYKAISFLFIGLVIIGSAAAVVVNIDGSALTPLSWFNSNKTVWDAKGNASYPINVSNATGVLPNASIPLSAMNRTSVILADNKSGVKNNYTVSQIQIETGYALASGSSDIHIDFVSPFSTLFAVTCSTAYSGAGAGFYCDINDPAVGGFDIGAWNSAGGRQGIEVTWVAIGLK